QPDRRHQPGPSDLRLVRGARSAPHRHQEVLPGSRRAPRGGAAAASAGDPGDRRAHLREQHGRPDDRDDPAQGHLRQHRQCPLARAVPRREPGPHDPHGDRHTLAGDPARPAGALRLRRQARPDRRVASGGAGHAARRGNDHRAGLARVRARGDRRPAPPRAGRPDRDPAAESVMSTDLFIRRPVLTTLLMAAILLFGIMGFRLLPVSDLPNVDFPADQPVLYLALSSPTLPLYRVDEYAQTNLAQRISTVTGVAQVQVFGSQKYAVRVQVDPRALTTRGIGLDEVEQALARSNVNMPTGTLFGSHQMFSVQATGQLQDAAAFRPLIVAYRNGSPVRLEELGRVVDGVQTDKVASWYNDERAVI